MLRIRSAVLAVAAFSLVACGGKDEAPAADTTVVTTPPPQAATAGATVSTMELGRHIGDNKRVTDTTSVFAKSDTFFLAVVSENAAPGATVTARWSYQTGQVVDSTSQVLAAAGEGTPTTVTEFRVTNPAGWPLGDYRVEVSINGAQKGAREFTVR